MSLNALFNLQCDSCGAIQGPGKLNEVISAAEKNQWQISFNFEGKDRDFCFFCRRES